MKQYLASRICITITKLNKKASEDGKKRLICSENTLQSYITAPYGVLYTVAFSKRRTGTGKVQIIQQSGGPVNSTQTESYIFR